MCSTAQTRVKHLEAPALTVVDAGEVLSASCATVVFAASWIVPFKADPITDLAFDGANIADRGAIATDLQSDIHSQVAERHHGGAALLGQAEVCFYARIQQTRLHNISHTGAVLHANPTMPGRDENCP